MSVNRVRTGLPMQPGEESWASFKCGGGVHNPEMRGTYHPAVKSVEQMYRLGTLVLPYAGGELALTDHPVRPDLSVLGSDRANLPA